MTCLRYLGWPGYDDALTTDESLKAVLTNTLDYLQSWDCGNCWPQYPPARVRAQDYETQANATWHTLLGYHSPRHTPTDSTAVCP